MTVSVLELEPKVTYLLTELVVGERYDIPFKFLSDEYIKVFVRDPEGEATYLTLDVDYEVDFADGDNNVWGTILMLRDVKEIQSICIFRDVEISQDIEFNSQTVSPDILENSVDKITMILQDKLSLINCVRATKDSDVTSDALEFSVEDAIGKYLYVTDDKRVIGQTPAVASMALRQGANELPNPTFELPYADRAGKIITFDNSSDVVLKPIPTGGAGIDVSADNVISLRTASKLALGGVIPGQGLSVSASGVVNVELGSYDLVEDCLVSTDKGKALSANQGRLLNENKVSTHEFDILNSIYCEDVVDTGELRLRNITYGKGTYIASSENALYSSVDRHLWEPAVTPEITTDIKKTVFSAAAGAFVATCDDTTLVSHDGKKWIYSDLALKDVYSCGDILIGLNGSELYVSNNGITWSSQYTSANTIAGVCYAFGQYVALDEKGNIAVSNTGVEWTEHGKVCEVSDDRVFETIVFGGRICIARTRSNELWWTSDLVSWAINSEFINSTLASDLFFVEMPKTGEYFFAFSIYTRENGFFFSYDGVHWESITALPNGSVEFAACGGVLVAYTGGTQISFYEPQHHVLDSLESTDPERPLSANQGNVLNGKLNDQAQTLNKRIDAVADKSLKRLLFSASTYNYHTAASAMRECLVDYELNRVIFLGVGCSGTIMNCNATGVTFDHIESDLPYDAKRIRHADASPIYSNNVFYDPKYVAGCSKSRVIFYDVEFNRLVNEPVTSDSDCTITDVAWYKPDNSEAAYYALTPDKDVVFVRDSKGEWSERPFLAAYCCCVVGGVLYAACKNGQIIAYDGLSYRTVYTGSTSAVLYCIAYTGEIFVAAGEEGTVLISPDGATWSRATIPDIGVESTAFFGISTNEGVILVSGKHGIVYSWDSVKWQWADAGAYNAAEYGWLYSVAVLDGWMAACSSKEKICYKLVDAERLLNKLLG